MKTRILALTLVFAFGFGFTAKSDEGMWLPFLLGKKYAEMQRLGLKLTPEQLYDINNASLKDAIVQLDGGGCTGEMISAQGLLLTNHHCGYGEIQAHSTTDHNYLEDGFWAYKMKEELVNPGKTASFLVRIEDVTEAVLEEVTDDMSESDRGQKISSVRKKIVAEATKDTHYNATVKSMFSGNEYYLFVYETFKDVRLVGAPPSSIGKFGGDTDNWVWPRHTGDFSIFRVYTAPDGTPAEYAKENIPYSPKHFLPVSIKGVKENDYAMIWGYPGTTDRYLSSYGVKQKMDELNPVTVKLRGMKMDIMKEEMNKDEAIKIQYASKIAGIGNFWKKDREESKALKALKVVDQKKTLEDRFDEWVNANEERKTKYGSVTSDFAEIYKLKSDKKYAVAWWYIVETTFFQGAEILLFAREHQMLQGMLEQKKDVKAVIEEMKVSDMAHWKDYNSTIDRNILATMFEQYYNDMPKDLHPAVFATIEKKFKGDFNAYAEYVFKKSVFASKESLNAFYAKPKAKTLAKDPAVAAMNDLFDVFRKMGMAQGADEERLMKSKRLFIAGLREMDKDKYYYPNANSTMRVTYGIVDDYSPRDAVQYDLITFLDGVMEKEDPDNDEFIVSPKLKELYDKKDYGPYGMNGKMPVCFLTNHDITGGNSGSPVINANGELIGTAFDGNSEAMSSDIQFNPDLQRTIVCDIRYVLFVMDKYAGAQNLIDELKIVK